MSYKKASGLFSGTNGTHRVVNGYTTQLHAGRQGKHILGDNNYQPGRSVFYGTLADAQKLIDRFAGTGTPVGGSHQRERVNFGHIIGEWVDPKTGERKKTSWGIIHYSKTGAHIVPSNPDAEE